MAKQEKRATASQAAPRDVTFIPSGAATVSLHDFRFDPEHLTISAGTTVVWTNDQPDTTHNVKSDSDVWDSGSLNAGQSFSHTFDQAGTFPYHCRFHESMGMKGSIEVQ